MSRFSAFLLLKIMFYIKEQFVGAFLSLPSSATKLIVTLAPGANVASQDGFLTTTLLPVWYASSAPQRLVILLLYQMIMSIR